MNSHRIPAALRVIFFAVAIYAHDLAVKTSYAYSLPSQVDNRATPYFPPVIRQQGESCASANGVGYIFTYEINAVRNANVADSVNQYPYFGVYNFLNDGSDQNGTYTMFVPAWEIIRDNGIANAIDFGAVDLYATKWMSGYEKYHRAMHNRIATIDSLNFFEPGSLHSMKEWLYNHRNGSPAGGIFTITASAYGVQDAQIATGPEKGKWILRKFGTSVNSGPHALAVVGYNDSIQYDYNRDGKITDTIDINRDGIVDQQDVEFGAFILANTWGESSGDGGFIYAPYRLFGAPLDSGGLISNRAYFITVHENYRPLRTFRVVLDHKHRNMIALSVGIAADTAAHLPDRVRSLRQFTYAGGDHPMCGNGGSSSIEIGLDVSDLLDSIPGAAYAAYYLIVDSKKSEGSCSELSLFDYTSSTTKKWFSRDTPRNLAAGRNIFRVVAPPMGIRKRNNATERIVPMFLQQNGIMRISLPDRMTGFEIFSLDGRCIKAFTINGDGGYHSIQARLQSGSFIFRLTGKFTTKAFPVIRK